MSKYRPEDDPESVDRSWYDLTLRQKATAVLAAHRAGIPVPPKVLRQAKRLLESTTSDDTE